MEACFSGPSIALLGVLASAIQATIVTLFWLLKRAMDAQVSRAEAREAEWRQLALRGANEIIPSLAAEVSARTHERLRELSEPRASQWNG